MWLGCHSPPGCGPSLGVLHNISTGDLGSTHKAWWKGGLVAGTPWGGDWRRAHGRHSLRQHRPQSALAARPPCDHPEALTPPPLRTPRMLPRKIGLPAARSFPGNRQEARSGAGGAGLSSRHAGAGSAGSGPAGPSREGGGREEGSGGSSLPAGRGWLFESLSGYGARVPLVSLVLCPSSAPGGLSLGRVSEQRGLWSPACCRSASDQRLPGAKPRLLPFCSERHLSGVLFLLVCMFLSFAWSLSPAGGTVRIHIKPGVSLVWFPAVPVLPQLCTCLCLFQLLTAQGLSSCSGAEASLWEVLFPLPSTSPCSSCAFTKPLSPSVPSILTFVPKGWSACCHVLFIHLFNFLWWCEQWLLKCI